MPLLSNDNFKNSTYLIICFVCNFFFFILNALTQKAIIFGNTINSLKSNEMEISTESAKKAQKDAEWAYDKAMEKFYYSMLEVVFLRIKSHLSEKGLKKVIAIDKKRSNNENVGIAFSQRTWEILAEAWKGAEGLAMSKIADLYQLDLSDIDISKIKSHNGKVYESNQSSSS